MKLFYAVFVLGLLASSPSALGTPAQQADLIVYGDYLLTMDPAQPRLHDAAVVVQGDIIVAIGTRAEIERNWRRSRLMARGAC